MYDIGHVSFDRVLDESVPQQFSQCSSPTTVCERPRNARTKFAFRVSRGRRHVQYPSRDNTGNPAKEEMTVTRSKRMEKDARKEESVRQRPIFSRRDSRSR